MNAQFEARRPDGRAVWRVIYDEIISRIEGQKLELNGVVRHDELKGLLKDIEMPGYFNAMGRVCKELQSKHARTLKSVRGSGYRLVGGSAQIEVGQSCRKRGERSIKNGLVKMITADRSIMSPADRTQADRVQNAAQAVVTILSMHHEKLIEHHAAIEELRKTQIRDKREGATADEVAELRRKVEELDARARDRERDK